MARTGRNAVVFRRAALSTSINPQAIASYRAEQAHLETAQERLGARDEPEELARMRAAIERLGVTGDYSGAALARELGMSPRTLQRRARALGTTVRELIEDVRFEQARHLLSNPDLSVFEVAMQLGYSSESTFGRAFRRSTGIGPAQFRGGKSEPGQR